MWGVSPQCSAATSTSAEIQAHMSTLLLVLVTLCMTSFVCVGLVAQFGPPSDLGRADLYFGIPILLALLLWLTRGDFSV
jgi:hypothetical protein